MSHQAKVKLARTDAKAPERQTAGAAGYDVFAAETVIINPGETQFIPLGVAVQPPVGMFIMLVPRGSFSLKKDLMMANSVGIGDEDFRGEYVMPLRNIGTQPQTIEKHERCGQMLFINYQTPEVIITEELDETERGEGKLGSTGKF